MRKGLLPDGLGPPITESRFPETHLIHLDVQDYRLLSRMSPQILTSQWGMIVFGFEVAVGQSGRANKSEFNNVSLCCAAECRDDPIWNDPTLLLRRLNSYNLPETVREGGTPMGADYSL